MNAKPKTELNRCVFVQKRNSVNQGRRGGVFKVFSEYLFFGDEKL